MSIWQHPAILLWLTLSIYWISIVLRARTGKLFINPVAISTIAMILYLSFLDIDYATYHQAGQFIDFWLKPAVVTLAVPLYVHWNKIHQQLMPVLLAQTIGSITGILTGLYFAKWLGASREVALSLVSKSVTNPIAIEISQSIGGIPAITAATVIIAGLTGQILGLHFMKISSIHQPSSQSLSIGAASHAMGIAVSLERSKKMAAYASLGLIFNGLLTAFFAPIIIPFTQ